MSIRITFVTADGTRHDLDVPLGRSLKDVALDHEIAGIIGECDGFAACGTCHAYVEGDGGDKLLPPQSDEELMLEGVLEREANSRLCCQIEVTDALDGLVLRVPEAQF